MSILKKWIRVKLSEVELASWRRKEDAQLDESLEPSAIRAIELIDGDVVSDILTS